MLSVFPNRLSQKVVFGERIRAVRYRKPMKCLLLTHDSNDLYNPFDKIQLGLALIAPTSDCVLHGIKVLLRMPSAIVLEQEQDHTNQFP